MAITSRDDWLSSTKQRSLLYKTTARTTVAGGWFCLFDISGNPGAGTLAIGNTANGVTPTDANAGYPLLDAFGASADGYLGRVGYSNTMVSQIRLYDRVFAAGAYAFNANTALSSQPSYSARIPSANYSGLELWVETATASTGNLAVNVTYTNQSGTTGRTTGAVGIGAATTLARCWQLPLQSGDSGVQTITNVAGSVASAGTFNVMVLRPLWSGYIGVANAYSADDLMRSGMRRVYDTSALYMLTMAPSGTSSGTPYLEIDVVNK